MIDLRAPSWHLQETDGGPRAQRLSVSWPLTTGAGLVLVSVMLAQTGRVLCLRVSLRARGLSRVITIPVAPAGTLKVPRPLRLISRWPPAAPARASRRATRRPSRTRADA